MLFYGVLFVCFLHTLAINRKVLIKPKPEAVKPEAEKTDQIFANVIKNISRVNDVLQELINNYEHLQKIYISQENFDEPLHSSDVDGDHLSSDGKKLLRTDKTASHTTPTPYRPYEAGTLMILSDIELDKTPKHVTEKPFDPMALSEASSDEEFIEGTPEPAKQLKVINQTIGDTTSQRLPLKSLRLKDDKTDDAPVLKNPEVTFDTNKKARNKTGKKNIMPKQIDNHPKKLKTRFNVKDTLKNNVFNDNSEPGNLRDRNVSVAEKPIISQKIQISENLRNPERSKYVEDTRILEKETSLEMQRNQRPRYLVEKGNTKKVTTPEDRNDSGDERNYATPRNINFLMSSDRPSNAENDRDSEKSKYLETPIESENPKNTELHRSSENPVNRLIARKPGKTKSSEENDASSDAESTPKIEIIKNIAVSESDTVTLKSEVDKKPAPISLNKKQEEMFSGISDDDDALTKDVFKTSVLRQAYGDACLKLVVRKCYKACKNTLKSSCRITKCKSEIKSYFKKTYKTACERAFEGTPDVRKLNSEHHVDVTREGFLSVACQPEMDSGTPSRRSLFLNKGPNNTSKAVEDLQVNLLRDRYEKACQKLSQNKCQSACNYAHDTTCEKFQCETRLKKSFKRNCKSQCKKAYSSTSKKKDKGSDSDGSGSDNGDDDDDDDGSGSDDD